MIFKQRLPSFEKIDQQREELFTTALKTGDGQRFLRDLGKWQAGLRPQSLEMRDLLALSDFCHCKDISRPPETPTPETYAQRAWAHEGAHQETAERHGIGSSVRVACLADGVYQPFLDVNTDDPAWVGKDHSGIFQTWGEILTAPFRQDLGYPSETDWGNRFLAKAAELKSK